MNQGVMQSSPVQQLVAAGGPSWWSINNMRAPPPILHHHQHSFLAAPPHHQPPTHQLVPPLSGWNDSSQFEELPESWSQLLLGGLVGEEDKAAGGLSHDHIHQAKKLEIWEQQFLNHQNSSVFYDHHHVIKQENPAICYSTTVGNSVEFLQQGANNNPTNCWSPHHHHPHQMMSSASSPKSSVTTLSINNNVLDFSHKSISDHGTHPKQEYPVSSECNSTATGGAAKKARINQPSSAQSTFKVRKEKLGDRITALHQIVSPFGKTDTASVLLEAIGYIRFLQNQIEALSLPYLGSATSANMKHQQPAAVQRERNCLFPENPGQLLNEKCNKRKGISDMGSDEEPKKDLRSRGLCLVPISCTLNVGTEINGADYWAPAFAAANFQ